MEKLAALGWNTVPARQYQFSSEFEKSFDSWTSDLYLQGKDDGYELTVIVPAREKDCSGVP